MLNPSPGSVATCRGGTRTEGMEGLAIRGAIAVVLSLLVAIRAFKHGSLSKSGAFMGFLVLSIHIAASYRFGAIILVFFFISSKLTKMGGLMTHSKWEGRVIDQGIR
ncbi:protein PGR-like isoform X2 [Nymphaea colorata]|uniref:protein PGR-like isoform X2 n=1 Tax=Nymphaea colorata TaxID=210225 RepID=UPI00214EEFB7|nr:protein PGR-like isoform X2 [Nymphaea colorata]